MRIFVAGHRGLVGSAIVRELELNGYPTPFTWDRSLLDLRDKKRTRDFFSEYKFETVFLAAATVGGIGANTSRPADFIADNLEIQTNVLRAAAECGVRRLVFFGSSCIYPKDCPIPMKESDLMSGRLEPTNSAYALAKLAGIEMCRAFQKQYGLRCLVIHPPNLYGPHDRFDELNGHCLPAMISKFERARKSGTEVTLWGSGTPLREFMYVDDLARAAVWLWESHMGQEMINVGSGEEISIRDLAAVIASATGYRGVIRWDPSRPNGIARKLLDSTRARDLGWRPGILLREGIPRTVDWYRESLT